MDKDFLKDFAEVLQTPQGIRVFSHILTDLGYFDPVYAQNSLVYKNAARFDFAQQLAERIKDIDFALMNAVEIEYRNRMKELIKEKKDEMAMADPYGRS